MKVNSHTLLRRLNGDPVTYAYAGLQPMKGQSKEAYQNDPVSLGEWAMHCLLDVVEIEGRDNTGRPIAKQLTEREKFERYQLATKFAKKDHGEITLHKENIELLKKVTNVAANTEVLGIVYDMLDTSPAED